MNASSSSSSSSRIASSSSSRDENLPPIPPSASKLVRNLKEILKNHSDDEIYAALRENHMDPNDALQKLMHQDVFHEVKRKRDKKKENNDTVEAKGNTSGSHMKSKVDFVRRDATNQGSDNKTNARNMNYQSFRPVNVMASPAHNQMTSNISNSSGDSTHFGPVVRSGWATAASQAPRKSWAKVSRHDMQVDSEQNNAVDAAAADSVSSLLSDVSRSVNEPVMEPSESLEDASSLMKHRAHPKIEHDLSDEIAPVVKPIHFNGRPRAHVVSHAEEQNKIGGKALVNNAYRNRVSYQSHEQVIATKRVPPGLEWKPKPTLSKQTPSEERTERTLENVVEKSSPLVPAITDDANLSISCPEPEDWDFLDERPAVIIPEHLQVPEAESAGLSFGSFDMDLEVKFAARLNLEESEPVDTAANADSLPEQSDPSVTEISSNVEAKTEIEASPTTPTELFVTSNDAVLSMAPEEMQPSEIDKSEHVIHEGRQLSYVQTIPNYQGFGLIPPPQYQYESGESQSQEIPRLPSFVQPFTDPASNYFSPVFRPGSDAEARYQFLPPNNGPKFSGNVTLMSGQTLSSSQEMSQNTAVSHATLAMVQPSLPVHAYAAQPTIAPYGTNVYGYQYVPPNYAYMHTPYQNSYSGNGAYPQPPIGSSFASAARGYPPVGTATLKYPSPQYKLGTNNTPHALVATGYGGFAAAPSGFAAMNPPVTAGSAASYDDIVGPQYKDNSLYTSSHQMEGSTIWVQAPLSRDPSGIPTNSYYNVHAQGQHAGYAHSQPTHAHPGAGFASYAQTAPTPNNQLQQPHALGPTGGGSHSLVFTPRGQVNWTNNYSVRNQ